MRKIALAIFAVLLSIPLSAQNGDIQKRISQYVEKVRKDWKIPGLSLAVIQGDSTIVMDGYGVKKVGGQDSVRSNTMFHIGSMSKAFTAAAISSLVDKGMVNWNDKVKDILPDFDWYCDSTEAVIEVKDLLTHSSGLVAQVGTYIPNLGYDRDDVYRMLDFVYTDYETFYKGFKNEKNLVIQAHPFRKNCILQNTDLLDGIEVFNLHPGHNSAVGFAAKTAFENPRLLKTGGTDFHHETHQGMCATLFKERIRDSFRLAEVLKSRDYILDIWGNKILPY